MNKFKEEQRQIFGQLRLSDERKEGVLQAVSKKRRNLVPTAIVACIVAICLFFAINGLQSNEDFTTASAIEAYEAYLKEYRPDMEIDIKHVELPFERNNDAIIIGIYEQEDSDVYYFQYMTFENGEWTFGLSGDIPSYLANEADGKYLGVMYMNYSHDFGNGGDTIYTGTYTDDIDTLFVGDKKAKSFNIGGEKIWIALANARAKPVYVEKDGVKKRIARFSYDFFNTEPNMVYELEGNQYTMNYDKDTMHTYGQEYTEFDIVIDPDSGLTVYDVVLVKGKNGPEVVRIQATNEMSSQEVSIKIQESTILINGTPDLEPYSWARAKGNVDYRFDEVIDYGVMAEDEVFVYPDNWTSDGVRGYIRTDQIIGKVLGYSIASVDEKWSSAEVEVYEKLKHGGPAILNDASPQEVARIQLYALIQEDYRTAHVLTEGISYEHMVNYFNEIKHENLNSFIRYYAYMIEKSTLDEANNTLIVKSNTSDEELFTWKMVRNERWNVKFESTIY